MFLSEAGMESWFNLCSFRSFYIHKQALSSTELVFLNRVTVDVLMILPVKVKARPSYTACQDHALFGQFRSVDFGLTGPQEQITIIKLL